MRAARIEQIGSPPVLGEAPEPERADGQALVEISAAPINPIDLSMAAGRFPGGSPEVPYTPGREGVGRVLRGERIAEGTRVYVGSPPGRAGAMAERCASAEAELFELPDEIDDGLAACLGIAGLAAWLPLGWRGRLAEGETVLVLGATGPVGTIAVQAAKLMGAGRVIAAARNREELERLKRLGADATVQTDAVDDLAQAFRDAAGDGGIQLVIDPLWGAPAVAALDALAPFGRLVQMGQTVSPSAELTSGAIRNKSAEIIGHTNFLAPRDVREHAYRELCEHAAAGRIQLEHEDVPLDQVAAAWERQERFPHGKLVLRP